MEEFIVNTGIPIAYYLTIFAAIIMGISFLLGTAMNLKKSLTFVIGFVVLLILLFVLYSSAGGEIPSYIDLRLKQYADITPGIMKFVGAGVTAAIILTIGCFVVMLLDMVVSLFK